MKAFTLVNPQRGAVELLKLWVGQTLLSFHSVKKKNILSRTYSSSNLGKMTIRAVLYL
jgi:hypothetical protein